MKSNEHNMHELIQGYIAHSGKQQLYNERVVTEKWPEYVGEMCAKQAHCDSVKNGVLRVRVQNAALRFELQARKSMILDKINSDYAVPVLKDIIFL